MISARFSESVINKLWWSSFFSKCSKFKLDFKNAEKNGEKGFSFWHNCIWIGCIKLSLWRREYLSMALNVLTNSVKIFRITNRDFLQLNCLPIYQSIWYRCCRSDLNNVRTSLPCFFLKKNLKRDLLDIDLPTFFGGRRLRNKSALRFISFIKMFKI